MLARCEYSVLVTVTKEPDVNYRGMIPVYTSSLFQ